MNDFNHLKIYLKGGQVIDIDATAYAIIGYEDGKITFHIREDSYVFGNGSRRIDYLDANEIQAIVTIKLKPKY